MGPVLMAIFLIAGGATVRVIGPSVGGRGQAKLLSYGLMLGGLATAAMNTVVVIDVGEVGVKHFLGTVDTRVLGQGVHVINPLASVGKMSVCEQQVAAEKFQAEIIEEQALQEIAAARGLAEAQQIISVGVTPEYLMFHYAST